MFLAKFYRSHYRNQRTRTFKSGGANRQEFFGKLWNLQLPSKITIIIWRISWNCIPTLGNLRHRRIATNASWPRDYGEENCHHIFRQCPISTEVWQLLNLSLITNIMHQNFLEWLPIVFKQGTNEQCRYFCYTLWLLWYSRNQLLHERVHSTGKDLAQQVQNHMAEHEWIRAKKILSNTVHNQIIGEDLPIMKIQFDVAFDRRDFRSASGLVVWGTTNEYLASKSILHSNIASPFAAKAYAGLEAIKLGIKMGFQEIQILGDSLTVIKKCQSTATDYSVIGAIIRDIQSKKSSFQKIEFKHILKTKNMRAHNIAKEALQRSERAYIEHEETIQHNMGAAAQWARNPD
ncbi:hypothetical protein CXB51_001202 [Gossypium anomalum]|uniref:RNase H type-1 domain-containing protein n=1 Tax=Gossypium anomalum TaxID=47600 RepID=A0A8J5ZAF1_9ROSI|nr:hypothetical protein CXB51_001202 [Gossypium anomalum]